MKMNDLRTPEMVLAKNKPGPVHLGLNIQTHGMALINRWPAESWYPRWFPNEFPAEDASSRSALRAGWKCKDLLLSMALAPLFLFWAASAFTLSDTNNLLLVVPFHFGETNGTLSFEPGCVLSPVGVSQARWMRTK